MSQFRFNFISLTRGNFTRALEKLFFLVWAFKSHLHFDNAKVQKIQIQTKHFPNYFPTYFEVLKCQVIRNTFCDLPSLSRYHAITFTFSSCTEMVDSIFILLYIL